MMLRIMDEGVKRKSKLMDYNSKYETNKKTVPH